MKARIRYWIMKRKKEKEIKALMTSSILKSLGRSKENSAKIDCEYSPTPKNEV